MTSGIPALPAYCFFVIQSKLKRTSLSPASSLAKLFSHDASAGVAETSTVDLDKQYPLFVTWSKRTGVPIDQNANSEDEDHGFDLRGCIGTFGPTSALARELERFAKTAAFDDTRFSPISERELPLLKCSVTLLDNFEDASSPLDWELGKHGIIINFTIKQRRYNATFLPDVATEQGWDKNETLAYLIRKAGARGVSSYKDIPEFKLVRYTGEKSSMTYEEFVEYSKELSS